MQDNDDKWRAVKVPFRSVDLPGDGFVALGALGSGLLLRLHRSEDAADDAFYANSKQSMDLALKALDITREVGADRVKVTSLGPASQDLLVTDRYGRRWQQRAWALPYLDLYVLGFFLPTPDGYLALISQAPSSIVQDAETSSKLLLDQFHVAYWGTMTQWQAFLRRRALLPAALSGLQIESGPWRVRAPLFELGMPEPVLPVNERSTLGLGMSFTKNGERVEWTAGAIWWYRDDRKAAYVGLQRVPRPPPSAKLDDRERFSSLRERRSPYDGVPTRAASDAFRIDTAIDVPGSKSGMVASDIVYGLAIQLDSYPSPRKMLAGQEDLRRTITIHERGRSEEQAALRPTQSTDAALEAYLEPLQELKKFAEGFGPDMRGRTLEQDLREYLVPVINNPVEVEKQLELLRAYWNLAWALQGTQAAWRGFLEKNRLPQDALRYPKLAEAESQLRVTLQRGPLSAAWADAVNTAIGAYRAERAAVLSALETAQIEHIDYRSRQSACPPPEGRTSGEASPRGARFPVPRPTYPTTSRRKAEEGVVILSLQIDAAGCVQRAGTRVSTGSDALDVAALDWIETAVFLPGEADGKPVAREKLFAVSFSLTD